VNTVMSSHNNRQKISRPGMQHTHRLGALTNFLVVVLQNRIVNLSKPTEPPSQHAGPKMTHVRDDVMQIVLSIMFG